MGTRFSEAFNRITGRGREVVPEVEGVRNETNRTAEAGLNMGNGFGKSFVTMAATTAVVAGIAAVGKATSEAVKIGMEYTKQMSAVEAVSGSTSVQMAELGSNARKLGADTKWSATNVAEAYEYMATAGWNSNQMLDASLPLLNLATAGALDLGRAADIVTDTMTPFGLAATKAGHVSDVFAKAGAMANLNVEQLGETMKYAAPIAATFGASLEDTTAVAMSFANGGIKASMAGTALRAGLSRLAAPPKAAANALEDMNVATKNSDGTMKGLRDIIADMAPKFKAMTDQQQIAAAKAIFGEEAYAGWILTLKGGVEEFDKFQGALVNSDGAAQAMASVMSNNLSGAMDNASSAAENLGLILFSRIEGGLTAATNGSIGFMTSLAQSIDPMNNLVEATKLMQVEDQKMAQTKAMLSQQLASGTITQEQYNQQLEAAQQNYTNNTTSAGILQQKMSDLDAQLAAGNLSQEEYNKKKAEAEVFSTNMGKTIDQEKQKQQELGEKINWLKGLWDELWKVLKPIWDNMASFIKEQYDKIMNFIKENSAEIEAVWKALWWVIETFIKPIWDGIKRVISGALDIIMGLIKFFGGILNGDWSKVWEGFKQILKGAFDIIIGLFDMAFMKTLIKAPLKFGKDILKWAGETFSNLLKGIGNWLKELGPLGSRSFGDFLKSCVNTLKNLPSEIGKWMSKATDKLKEVDWKSVGKKLVQSLIDGIVSLGSKLASEVGNIASKLNPLNAFKGAPDTPVGRIGGGQLRSATSEVGLSALPTSGGFMQAPTGLGGLSRAMEPMMSTLSTLNSLGSSSSGSSSDTTFQSRTPQSTSSGSITVEVPLYIDKREFARATAEVMSTEQSSIKSRHMSGIGASKFY
jgi:TP901 family phage tail tape measure protein